MRVGSCHRHAMTHLLEQELTQSIIGAFYEVYNTLGFGFFERIYVMALERELRSRGHHVDREVGVSVFYKGEELCNQRIDMIVDGKVVVETKSTLELPPATRRQLRNYLGATKLEVGLVLHFGPRATFYREVRTPGWVRRAGPELPPKGTTEYVP